MTDIFLYSNQTWIAPSDCRKINFVRAYGAGANGQSQAGTFGSPGGYGGGGGAFSDSGPFAINPGDAVSVVVGQPGSSGGDTYFNYGGYRAYAQGAQGQTGGQAGNGVGATRYSGGTGGPGGPVWGVGYGGGGGGGGGAAGPSGGGYNGAAGSSQNGGGGGSGDGSYAASGGIGGQGAYYSGGVIPSSVGGAGNYYGAGGGGGGGGSTSGFHYLPSPGSAGGTAGPGLIWINYDPSYVWPDNAGVSGEAIVGAQAGVKMPIASHLGVATGVKANTTGPQLYMSAKLSPASLIMADAPNRIKAIKAGLSASLAAIGRFQGPVSLGSNWSIGTGLAALDTVAYSAKALLAPGVVFTPFLSQKSIIANFAALNASTGIVAKPMLPLTMAVNWNIGPQVGVNVFPAQFISAAIAANASLLPMETIDPYQWLNYGSQLLYAAASGLEKAMIDADAPRLLEIDAEAIVASWDPYSIDIKLLPYLAWAMGVNFWNDKWSDQTKRDWVAAQWQFKALRGSDAAIEMAIDFAGRDISPFGYKVRDIITAPQGQYPSPGITQAQQEAWLASLPQVRVYLNSQSSNALPDELYTNASFISPG